MTLSKCVHVPCSCVKSIELMHAEARAGVRTGPSLTIVETWIPTIQELEKLGDEKMANSSFFSKHLSINVQTLALIALKKLEKRKSLQTLCQFGCAIAMGKKKLHADIRAKASCFAHFLCPRAPIWEKCPNTHAQLWFENLIIAKRGIVRIQS